MLIPRSLVFLRSKPCWRLLRFIDQTEMSTFVSTVNPLTGKMEWNFRDESYDYNQEIARSAYADMLHDTERNKKYDEALKKAIEKRRRQNQPVNVLDIGTGTSLLSMMAARQGADTVTACEAFHPMAECARKIMKENGYGEKIKLVPKRSTELEVGKDKDLSERANILVTEVFDTELIGEGAVSTYTHAHKHLLQEDSIVVPMAANMYVQLVSSDLVRRWNQIDDLCIQGAGRLTSPDSISSCGGAPSLHDLQLDQLPVDTFTKLTEPIKVFRFDFRGKPHLKYEDKSTVITTLLEGGSVDAVFMWWDLEMDEDGDILLSCAPRWAHPTPNDMQWRDHWMQAIYYPYKHLTFKPEEKVKVISRHDEYSLWFDVAKETSDDDGSALERPVCTCETHITFSRSRLGMMSDPHRRQVYLQALKQHITKDTVCLCLSDGSLLSAMAAQLGAKHVFAVEPNPFCARFIKKFAQHNKLEDKITILSKGLEVVTSEDLLGLKLDLVIGEPVFQTSVLPWDNVYFWYALQQLTNHLADGHTVLPRNMAVRAVCVEYEHLWKIRADVGDCEGFNLRQFDSLIQKTSVEVDANVEPQPLWEYPCTAVSDTATLLEVDFTRSVSETKPVSHQSSFTIDRGQSCNGLALWADFDFGAGSVVSTGPQRSTAVGEKVVWDYYTRQGVNLLQTPVPSKDSSGARAELHTDVSFRPAEGNVSFKFTPKTL